MAERTATLLEIERFQQQGFVLISGLLAGQEGKHYGDAVDRAVADRTQHDHRSLEEKSRYEQSFQQCLNPLGGPFGGSPPQLSPTDRTRGGSAPECRVRACVA